MQSSRPRAASPSPAHPHSEEGMWSSCISEALWLPYQAVHLCISSRVLKTVRKSQYLLGSGGYQPSCFVSFIIVVVISVYTELTLPEQPGVDRLDDLHITLYVKYTSI